jgi:hypothetical protein
MSPSRLPIPQSMCLFCAWTNQWQGKARLLQQDMGELCLDHKVHQLAGFVKVVLYCSGDHGNKQDRLVGPCTHQAGAY